MKKAEAISLFVNEGWTKADAERALEGLDFKLDPDELTVYKHSSLFAGKELNHRQRLQAAQKATVTKKIKEINVKVSENKDLQEKTTILNNQNNKLSQTNEKLVQVKDELMRDNRSLQNIIAKIRLTIPLEVDKLMQLEDSEIRKALSKWIKGMQG